MKMKDNKQAEKNNKKNKRSKIEKIDKMKDNEDHLSHYQIRIHSILMFKNLIFIYDFIYNLYLNN